MTDAGLFGGPVLSSLGNVVIQVINSGTSPSCNFASFSIPERSPTGTTVGTVSNARNRCYSEGDNENIFHLQVTCTNADLVILAFSITASGPNTNRPFPFDIVSPGTLGTSSIATVGSGSVPSTPLDIAYVFFTSQVRVAISPTNGELDFEGTFNTYNATVTATTVSAQALSGSTPIFISLSNVMENPYFVPGAGLANPGIMGAGVFNYTVPEHTAG